MVFYGYFTLIAYVSLNARGTVLVKGISGPTRFQYDDSHCGQNERAPSLKSFRCRRRLFVVIQKDETTDSRCDKRISVINISRKRVYYDLAVRYSVICVDDDDMSGAYLILVQQSIVKVNL